MAAHILGFANPSITPMIAFKLSFLNQFLLSPDKPRVTLFCARKGCISSSIISTVRRMTFFKTVMRLLQCDVTHKRNENKHLLMENHSIQLRQLGRAHIVQDQNL